MNKARYWLVTIPEEEFTVPGCLLKEIDYMGGQLEVGNETGYRHWQVMVAFNKQVRRTQMKRLLGSKKIHGEPTRSDYGRKYCFKEETAVHGTQFQCGSYSVRRNERTDWELVRTAARAGEVFV